MRPCGFPPSEWRRGDSNPHGLAPTAPCTQRVYQFHHFGSGAKGRGRVPGGQAMRCPPPVRGLSSDAKSTYERKTSLPQVPAPHFRGTESAGDLRLPPPRSVGGGNRPFGAGGQEPPQRK